MSLVDFGYHVSLPSDIGDNLHAKNEIVRGLFYRDNNYI